MAKNRYNYGSTALKEDPKAETTPTLQEGKRRAARHWRDLQKESR